MKIDSLLKSIGILMVGVSCLMWSSTRHNFQLIQLGEMARNQFLLDKGTGRVWQKVCDGENKGVGECDGILVWEEMYVSDLTPAESRPALIYDYIVKQRDEEKEKKEASKK